LAPRWVSVAPVGATAWHQHGCKAVSQQGGVGWVTAGSTVAAARIGVRRGGNWQRPACHLVNSFFYFLGSNGAVGGARFTGPTRLLRASLVTFLFFSCQSSSSWSLLMIFGPRFAHRSRSPFSRSGAGLVSIFLSLLWLPL
jgi:hypothetical protein